MWLNSELTRVEMMHLFDLYPEDLVEDPPGGLEFPDTEEKIATLETNRSEALLNLYITYHSYRQFAEEVVNISLREVSPLRPTVSLSRRLRTRWRRISTRSNRLWNLRAVTARVR
ncbi:hypothetical protein HT576_22505 [Haloterrigena sp. SYSU A121-1]|uniref:Uncharacterized protein n=1 Tax=Haloterrigena gelatinilytica TaxID=2741724 RepID=A0A8J8GPT1_9EURY|nr:hypothetical protein [Haloterrigena gelatinilytica]NUB93751.1 hypothetical protein [Haloterrigena gelatinilytica]